VVDLGDDVEGFVPTSQLGGKEITDPTDLFKEGEQIPLQVIEFDQHQHKVVLSVVAYFRKREREEFDAYLAKHSPAGGSLGDAMPEELAAEAEKATEAPKAEAAPAKEAKEAEAKESPAEEAEAEAAADEAVPEAKADTDEKTE
jgi:transcriptional accessory protein Tex/SPT6